MAVENKYVNADLAANKKANSAFNDGAATVFAVATFEVAAADDDGSIYRIFKNVNSDLIPARIEVYNDAITGGTSYDLGLYQPRVDGQGGDVVDKDVFAATLDMSAAAGRGSPKEGLGAVNIADSQKRIYELAGDTLQNQKLGYDIAVTANTVGTAAGTVTVLAWFVQG